MKTTDSSDEPAFPCPAGHTECSHPTGITRLEYYAGLALQAMLSDPEWREEVKSEVMAAMSFDIAQAMCNEAQECLPKPDDYEPPDLQA